MNRFLFNPAVRMAMLSLAVLASSLASPPAQAAPTYPVAGTSVRLYTPSYATDAGVAVSQARQAIGNCSQNRFSDAIEGLERLVRDAAQAVYAPSETALALRALTNPKFVDSRAIDGLIKQLRQEWGQAQPCDPPESRSSIASGIMFPWQFCRPGTRGCDCDDDEGPCGLNPIAQVTPFALGIGDVSSGWFSGEDNPAGTGNNVVNGIGVIDKGTVLAGIRAALAFPNPLQATTNGCCSDLEQRVNIVLEIGGSFAEGDSSTSLNGITSGRDRFGFPFADPNNTGVSLGDPNASVDMTNKRELEFAEATAAFWWRLFSSPGLGQSLFGIGGAVSNLDMEESVRYMVNAPAFAPGRFDGTYDHDSDTDCGRFWGGAQTRLGATANTQLRVRGELGVTACDTDLRHTALFNDTGAVLSETSTSFSDSENAFYAKGELALDINLQNIFGAGAKATVHGAVSTGDILVPTLDVAAGTGVIDWENPLNTEVGVTVSIPLGPQQSDRRLKRDIAHVATLENGIRLYAFRYLWDDQLHIGVMAQDLRADETFKDAVVLKPNGFYAVDYGKLGLKMTTLEAWREYGLASVMARPVSGGASASLTQPLR